ncbi:MAG: hypothetical protein K2H89_09795, partial [Oscillospiraceae bacterium]|nr:hypothetical protein [Oscillospiraceae bacterium]
VGSDMCIRESTPPTHQNACLLDFHKLVFFIRFFKIKNYFQNRSPRISPYSGQKKAEKSKYIFQIALNPFKMV